MSRRRCARSSASSARPTPSWAPATRRWHTRLAAEPELGLLLPCNVVVYADGQGRAAVSAIDPIALFAVVGRAELAPVAEEVARRLQLALAGLPD